jgi:hypothetical protein
MFEVVVKQGVSPRFSTYNVYENEWSWYCRATSLESAQRIVRLLNEDDMQLRIANSGSEYRLTQQQPK